ncbi:phosphohistidine phosphatase SixA [Hahella sp. HN01]|uniref:phosphohistidine phosphatase SixA n=1 Tax=Hahella sp. HN01 TaxID=2847262 RepID=UPI001C1E9FE2|nr:phosphohistidine phosphatase SixA [Hahella sp. HN01]MBU6954485.1 phosphohistidine phosphatase SixA [Hahella sp. HN01]
MRTCFLMRHGEAEMRAPSDSLRELTAYGRTRTREVAERLASHHDGELTLLHSPYVRATQTAEIVGEVFSRITSVHVMELATPDDDPRACLAALESFASQNLILVTHMPLVAALAALLEHGGTFPSTGFQTSEIREYEMPVWGLGCAMEKSRIY